MLPRQYGVRSLVLVLVLVCAAMLAGSACLAAETLGPNLLYNGDFDNHVWYQRVRGWTPSGWYEWFTCGDDAPEHAVGKDKPHTGKEYVRIHMWAYNWRGGVLQNVKDVVPGHWYRLTGYGWFAKPQEAPPQAVEKIGLDPYGKLADQFSVDVHKHPAPPYNECVGDDPKTPQVDYPDIPDTTVWSATHDYYNDWGKFETEAEACSDVITAILYSESPQRADPIYEMNWDSISLREIPWPTKRLAADDATLPASDQFEHLIVMRQPGLKTLQVTWTTKVPAGAVQAIYRFLDAKTVVEQAPPTEIRLADYPFETPVAYERNESSHWIELSDFTPPADAARVEVVALSRALVDGKCVTLCSAPKLLDLK
jgi:hypothetical protein